MGIDKSQLKSGRDATADGTSSTDATDNRQGFSAANIEQNKYMTGIYGYQQGYASFGIMENGTAFFGRADRGGRIIIDGYNATIYGGANGELRDPTIGDPMWNAMRLTFVDLTHATGPGVYNPNDGTKIAATEVDGVKQGFDGKYYGMNDGDGNSYFPGRDFPWWYKYIWQNACVVDPGYLPPNIAKIPIGANVPGYHWTNYWDNSGEPIGDPTVPKRLTGFKPSRASTTPAIEIGQHVPGLTPGLLVPSQLREVLRDIKIPGNRNFLVTYDGSLWAMNATIVGNIIGSNIMGGSIIGAELHIGYNDNNYSPRKYSLLTSGDNWR
jgi:hypothetical protein